MTTISPNTLADPNGDAIDTHREHSEAITSPESVIGVLPPGSATAGEPVDATADPYGDTPLVLDVQARWREPYGEAHHFERVRGVFDATTPYSTGGIYVNFVSGVGGAERVHDASEETFARLLGVEAERDPPNVSSLNQHIEPAG